MSPTALVPPRTRRPGPRPNHRYHVVASTLNIPFNAYISTPNSHGGNKPHRPTSLTRTHFSIATIGTCTFLSHARQLCGHRVDNTAKTQHFPINDQGYRLPHIGLPNQTRSSGEGLPSCIHATKYRNWIVQGVGTSRRFLDKLRRISRPEQRDLADPIGQTLSRMRPDVPTPCRVPSLPSPELDGMRMGGWTRCDTVKTPG
jgi:hypothetical protein